MSIDVGSIELYMGGPGAPDDLGATIVDFIDDAREELFVAVQELEERSIAEAIIRARQRGLRVRVVLEGHYLTVDHAVDDPFTPGGKNEDNREIHAALLRAKVGVITDLNPKIYHQKYVVRDPKDDRAALLSGSTNFTPTGIGRNLNHLVVVHGKRVTRLYHEEFKEAWTGTFGTLNSRFEGGPRSYTVSGVCVKTLFSPDHSPELEIMKQMLKAEGRVDFAMFTFAQSSGIDDTMIRIRGADIGVRGVLDPRQANQDWAATRPLADNGVELHKIRPGTGVGKLHHKLMVLDRKAIIVGSFNYTGPANRLNDENIMIIGSCDRENDDQSALAEFALGEIDRIIEDLSEPIQ